MGDYSPLRMGWQHGVLCCGGLIGLVCCSILYTLCEIFDDFWMYLFHSFFY